MIIITQAERDMLSGMADQLDQQLNTLQKGPMPSREFSLFLTKLEESYLWLRRAIEKLPNA